MSFWPATWVPAPHPLPIASVSRLLLVLVVLGGLGCSGLGTATPTPTPVRPTETPLHAADRQRWAAFFYLERGQRPGWQARQGMRVVRKEFGSDDVSAACPPGFPVWAKDYGYYYLPSDELYGHAGLLDLGDLCFAAEEDAITAGYQRGPH